MLDYSSTQTLLFISEKKPESWLPIRPQILPCSFFLSRISLLDISQTCQTFVCSFHLEQFTLKKLNGSFLYLLSDLCPNAKLGREAQSALWMVLAATAHHWEANLCEVIQFVTPVSFKDLSLEYMKDSDSTKKNPPWEYQIMSCSSNSPLPNKAQREWHDWPCSPLV